MGNRVDLRLLSRSLAGISALQPQQAGQLLREAPWLAALLSHPWTANTCNGIATSTCTHASRGPRESLKQHMPRSKVYTKENYEHLRRTRWDLDEMRKLMDQPTSSQVDCDPRAAATSSGSSSSSSRGRSGSSTPAWLPAERTSPRHITRLISEAVTVEDVRAVVKEYGASFNALALAAAITKVPKVAGVTVATTTRMQPPGPTASVERLLDRLVPRLAPLLSDMSVRQLSNVLWAMAQVGYDPGPELLARMWQEVLQGPAGSEVGGAGPKLASANGQELAALASAAHFWGQRGWANEDAWQALEDAAVAAAQSGSAAAAGEGGSGGDLASARAGAASSSAVGSGASNGANSSAVGSGTSRGARHGPTSEAHVVAGRPQTPAGGRRVRSGLSGPSVSVIAAKFVHEKRNSQRLMLALAQWAAVPQNAATMPAASLSMFLGALAVTEGLTAQALGPSVLSVLSEEAAGKVWDASMHELGRMAAAMGTLGGPTVLLEAIAGRLEKMTRGNPSSSSGGGDSSSTASSGADTSSSGSSAVPSSSIPSSSARTIHGVPAALAKIAWATAQLGGPPRPVLLRAAGDRLASHPSEFTPGDATHVLSAAAKLAPVPGFELGGWWAEVGKALVPHLGSFSPRHVVFVAHAYLASGQGPRSVPKALLAVVADVAERRAAEFDARGVMTVVCLFEKLRYGEGARAAAKLGAVLLQIVHSGRLRANSETVVRTVRALDALGVVVPGLQLSDELPGQQQQQQQQEEEHQPERVAGSGAL